MIHRKYSVSQAIATEVMKDTLHNSATSDVRRVVLQREAKKHNYWIS